MPKTASPRKPRQTPDVHYSPMFPGGNNGQRRDNSVARVMYGDNGVNQRVKDDYARTYGDLTKSKKYK